MLARRAVLAVVLFALNAWICHRLFTVEFTTFQSNEAAFIAISRFFRDHWNDLRWFPWFDGGMPVENAYQPVLPTLAALLSAAGHWSIGQAFHIVLALAYCMGPVTLFWFVWDWSESPALSFLAGLLYSLISPAAMLFPSLRGRSGGFWTAQRLFNLVWYGEAPHNLALTLLPVALLFLRRAIVRRDRWSLIGAVVSCSAVVLTNAFGVLTLALGAICIALALKRGIGTAAGVGLAAWCWCSPWLPPSLIETIRAWSARGQYDGGARAYVAASLVLLVFGVVWMAARRLTSSFERFVWLFAPWMCAFPVVYYAAGITLVPQPHRYISEMELAICLLLAGVCIRMMNRGAIFRGAVTVALGLVMVHQAWAYRNLAHSLIRPVDVTKTVEYKAAMWIDRNLPAQRTMVSGDAAWLLNVFSDNPQMSAGHEPTAPNSIQQIAVHTLYTGMNAGSRDTDVSILWLKAFGNQAVTVPGPDTHEVYQPFSNAGKFEGVLPVLWREDGDTIYGVPQRSRSLAHVIPNEAVVRRRPVDGLDVEPLRAYVAALDNTGLPVTEIRWIGLSKARITARMAPGQTLTVQVNHDPGWHARVGGAERPVRPDGLGLMTIETGCEGDCLVDLEYGPTSAIWICRVLSGVVCAGLFGMAVFGTRWRQ